MEAAHVDPPLYGLDIETDTRVDGLDARVAAVVAVAVAGPHGDAVLAGDERRILAELDRFLAGLPTGVIVTWNGSGFDLPFLHARARLLEVPLGLRLRPAPGPHRADADQRVRARWHQHAHLDGYLLYRGDVGRALPVSCGLKPMARLVGLRPVEVDRQALHELPADIVARYVLSDARATAALVARRWPGARPHVDRY